MRLFRIKKRKDFLAVNAKEMRFVSPSLVLQAFPKACLQDVGLGFTTTKKLGKAVIRNRIRRRLKEVCRLYQGWDHFDGFYFVIIGRKAALYTEFTQLQSELKTALEFFLKRENAHGNDRTTERK